MGITPCPVITGAYLETTTHTMGIQVMFARPGWTVRLLTWRAREMVLASMAGFLRLKFKDMRTQIQRPIKLMFTLTLMLTKLIHILTPKLTKLMEVTLMTLQL